MDTGSASQDRHEKTKKNNRLGHQFFLFVEESNGYEESVPVILRMDGYENGSSRSSLSARVTVILRMDGYEKWLEDSSMTVALAAVAATKR